MTLRHLVLAWCFHSFSADDPVVQTPLGAVRGVDYGKFHAFKGVPYAEKPRRFAAPAAKLPWSKNATLDATHFGHSCIHGGENKDSDTLESFSESEDCLYANVWVPKSAQVALPVVVFIHGGGFMLRSGNFPGYWGDGFVTNPEAPAILVTFNYRLGIFGFFSWEDSDTNFGLQDQQMLLRWVKTNIAAFGGDASKILLTGQSAGAMSVVCHLAAPGSRGLFHRAMANSPVGLHYRGRVENEAFVRTVARAVGCDWQLPLWPSNNVTACMRSKSAAELQRADIVPEYLFHLRRPCKECDNLLPWLPVVDPATLPATPLETIVRGEHYKVPTVVSSTRNETLAFVPTLLLKLANNQPAFDVVMSELFKDRANQMKRHYRTAPDTKDLKSDSLVIGVASTDALVTCYVRFLVRSLARHAPAFLSTFHVAPHNSEMHVDALCVQGPPHGASCHAGDLLFALPASRRMSRRSGVGFADGLETNFASRYARAIIDFADGKSSNVWEAYRETDDIGVTWNLIGVGKSHRYHEDHCDFLESIGFASEPWGAPRSMPSALNDPITV